LGDTGSRSRSGTATTAGRCCPRSAACRSGEPERTALQIFSLHFGVFDSRCSNPVRKFCDIFMLSCSKYIFNSFDPDWILSYEGEHLPFDINIYTSDLTSKCDIQTFRTKAY
jgi:hypothetical protein